MNKVYIVSIATETEAGNIEISVNPFILYSSANEFFEEEERKWLDIQKEEHSKGHDPEYIDWLSESNLINNNNKIAQYRHHAYCDYASNSKTFQLEPKIIK